jgi:hypothetical protein
MWNLKINVIPAIIGINGPISKSCRKYLKNISEQNKINELKKTAMLGRTHILWNVLM